MRSAITFTVEVSADDDFATEVLTRQLRVGLRALGPLSLEPVFASIPVSPEEDPTLPPATSARPGVIAASGVVTDATVKGLFELLAAFGSRAGVGTVTVRCGDAAVPIAGGSVEAANHELGELERLLGV